MGKDGNDETIRVERLGGFAGFGLPGSRLRSCGEVQASALTPADRGVVDSLFANPPAPGSGVAGAADGFRYRLTRPAAGGEQHIEVDEHHVPPALQACVKDELAP